MWWVLLLGVALVIAAGVAWSFHARASRAIEAHDDVVIEAALTLSAERAARLDDAAAQEAAANTLRRADEVGDAQAQIDAILSIAGIGDDDAD